MPCCCSAHDYESVFTEKEARNTLRAYRRKGLGDDERRIVDFVRSRMAPGYSLLEVGGGIGAIQVELLRDGAARATNVELAPTWESAAAELLREASVLDRVERRIGDFVAKSGSVEPADVVVMHRVVCCYPDADRLVGAAAAHARRLLLITVPRDNWAGRAVVALLNVFFVVRRLRFRSFGHPISTIVAAGERAGLRVVGRHRGFVWQFIALERTG
jgi:2-polyprenyl-3-methyl-5-hydroxy-6-metoxy-1,4-benzoquinol methylase